MRARCFLFAAVSFAFGLFVFRVMPNPFSWVQKADYVDHPQGFSFIAHRRLKDRPRFTVVGELRNATGTAWKRVEVVTSIYAGQAYMTYCVKELQHVAKGEIRNFVLVCRETAGSGLPKNVSYELAVSKAVPE